MLEPAEASLKHRNPRTSNEGKVGTFCFSMTAPPLKGGNIYQVAGRNMGVIRRASDP